MSGGVITSGWAPWVSVSRAAAFDDSLSASDRSVLLALYSYMNSETRKGYPSRKALRQRAKVSEATLTRAIKKLSECGYVTVEEVYLKDANGNYTGERGANNYHMVNV